MTIYKELLLLKRDFGGLVILFVMPLALIVTITLIQDSSFKSMSDVKIPILLVDEDHGEISKMVKENLSESGAFEIINKLEGKTLTEEAAKKSVFRGDYQLAIVLPKDLSNDLKKKVNSNVQKIMQNFDIAEDVAEEAAPEMDARSVNLYFDPAAQLTFRDAVINSIDKLIAKIEKDKVYGAFQESLGIEDIMLQDENFITFKEISPELKEGKALVPNSVQHNVPAWSLFAIFFIIVPLSINIVKEKGQGTQIRLITNPVPYSLVIVGKTITYLIISMIQFVLMLLIGLYLFPYLGLPGLELHGTLFLMLTIAIFSGLAAIGLGILLGTVAKTQEQAAPFGATFVVILAAIGGVWVPVFIMPKMMQVLSQVSPMNWGLNAFYDVLLRKAGILEIFPEIILLFLFFVITVVIAILYDKKKRAV